MLFDRRLLDQYLADQSMTAIADLDQRMDACVEWVANTAKMGKLNKAHETQLEGQFAQLLAKALDYTVVPSPAATLWAKPPTQHTGLTGTPDLAIGNFGNLNRPEFVGVLELKGPGTDLDKPQASRADQLSAVGQSFDYGTHILGVRWVLVSDMRVIRLYSVDDSSAFVDFDLSQMGTESEFRRMWSLISSRSLVGGATDSLLSKSSEQRIALSQGFYEAYSTIRVDLFEAIKQGADDEGMVLGRDELLGATQRLLDRLIFVYYCEDHPDQLINNDTVRRVAETAASLPGASTVRVYEHLKALFREVDAGSPPTSGLKLSAYNGELFKDHPVIDHIDLPDDLHTKRYVVSVGTARTRVIKGAWGLDVFDFWAELDEHMLGKVFEESLSDLVELGSSGQVAVAEKMRERKRGGIFYTQDILADFTTYAPLKSVIDHRAAAIATENDSDPNDPGVRLEALFRVKVLDLACGSGAFVVSAYRQLLAEFWRLQNMITKGPTDLFTQHEQATHAALLRDCLFGIDVLPQAVDIAKLALWLRSARREEKVPDLSANFAATDSLDLDDALSRIGLKAGDVDLCIGNPPWGASMKPAAYAAACQRLGIDLRADWDSWEVFLLLGLETLRPGGRLAFVLPDSLLYEAKEPIREILLSGFAVERLHSLGPDWFGAGVRMGTVVLDVRNEPPGILHDIKSVLLSGNLRRSTQTGRTPLRQVESQRSRDVPQARSDTTPSKRIEVFRSRQDDAVLSVINSHSERLDSLTHRTRGEEINKAGTYWRCPSCNSASVPGRKVKGSYEDKKCANCGATLTEDNAIVATLVGTSPGGVTAPWLSGNDVNRRYHQPVPRELVRTDLPGWRYKKIDYATDKLLIRQAGVGVMATIDTSGAWVPQSIYVYRPTSDAVERGYTLKVLLAVLLSRTMAYVVFKQFAETDPAKAHAKLTQERLSSLPIPHLDLTDPAASKSTREIEENVSKLLAGSAKLGGIEDWAIETALRRLWGLTGDDGTYINGQFADLPDGQALRDLFPDGAPDPVTLELP